MVLGKHVPSQRLHSIGEVADRTRLSLDVLRVWERRYGVVEPTRDEAGRRQYSDADVDRLRLLALATESGRSIKQVAGLPTEELREWVREAEASRYTASPAGSGGPWAGDFVEQALVHTRALDGEALDEVLRRSAALLGMPSFLEEVVTVLSQRIGAEWHAGRLSIAQEHLASGVLRPLLTQLRNALPAATGAPQLLVATPAGERHEIGALLAAGVAAVEGWRVTYLGADLPAAEIAAAALETGARAVALSSVYVVDPHVVVAELRLLRARLPGDVAILLGGAGLARLREGLDAGEFLPIASLRELRDYLRDGAFQGVSE